MTQCCNILPLKKNVVNILCKAIKIGDYEVLEFGEDHFNISSNHDFNEDLYEEFEQYILEWMQKI